jgi:Ca-activated chloride channel family protein
LKELAPNLRNVRMFTLGIDQAVNAAFLKRLASAGGGLCELVESEDRLDAVMAKVHRRIGTPIATELALRASGLDIDLAQLAPKKLPDVYAGAPVAILGRYKGSAGDNASLEIEGTSLGDPLRVTVVRDAQAASARALGASWARARIRDLEDRYAIGERGNLESEIVGVSKRFSVLSRFTAFLAIDRSQVVNAGGNLRQVVQPVEEPAGWEGAPAQAPVTGRAASVRARFAPPSPPMKSKKVSFVVGSASANAAMPQGPGSVNGAPIDAKADAAKEMRRSMEASPMPAPATPPAMPRGGAPRLGGAMPPAPAAAPKGAARRPADIDDRIPAPELESEAKPTSAASAYHAKLGTLARELDAQGRLSADAAMLRVIRQRLAEWVEDVRSVGGYDALASAVERLVQRLASALAGGGALATEARAIAAELTKLAAGAQPPKPSRAFWK